jgi:hypothetical protein
MNPFASSILRSVENDLQLLLIVSRKIYEKRKKVKEKKGEREKE